MKTGIEITWSGQPNLETTFMHKFQWQKNSPVGLVQQN